MSMLVYSIALRTIWSEGYMELRPTLLRRGAVLRLGGGARGCCVLAQRAQGGGRF